MDNTKTMTDVLQDSTTAREVGKLAVSLIQYALHHPFRAVPATMLILGLIHGSLELFCRWTACRSKRPSKPPEPVDWVIGIRDPSGNVVRTVTIPADLLGRMTRAWDDQAKRR